MRCVREQRGQVRRARGAAGGGPCAVLAAVMVLIALSCPALALKPIVVEPDQDRIEITTRGEFRYEISGSGIFSLAFHVPVEYQVEGVRPDGLGNAYFLGNTETWRGHEAGFLDKYDTHGNLLWELNPGRGLCVAC